MSDEAENEDIETEGGEPEGNAASEAKKGIVRRLAWPAMIALPIVILAVGGYFTINYLGWLQSDGKRAVEKPMVYYDLPEMVVNLSSHGKRAQYLKLSVSLEVADRQTITALQPKLPRVLDLFQVYLRELRSSDLEGSAGIYRLKEELLRRVNIALRPKRVDRILFREILVQ